LVIPAPPAAQLEGSEEHAPALQNGLPPEHATAAPHVPLAPHVCTLLPEHCVAPAWHPASASQISAPVSIGPPSDASLPESVTVTSLLASGTVTSSPASPDDEPLEDPLLLDEALLEDPLLPDDDPLEDPLLLGTVLSDCPASFSPGGGLADDVFPQPDTHAAALPPTIAAATATLPAQCAAFITSLPCEPCLLRLFAGSSRADRVSSVHPRGVADN
jgi:hypothetical protein